MNDGLGHPAILGIEPFNEPYPGMIPKKDFEVKYLMDFYRKVNSKIAKVDKDLFIFIEPRVDWTISSGEGDMPVNYGASPLALKKSFNMDFIKKALVDKKIVSKEFSSTPLIRIIVSYHCITRTQNSIIRKNVRI